MAARASVLRVSTVRVTIAAAFVAVLAWSASGVAGQLPVPPPPPPPPPPAMAAPMPDGTGAISGVVTDGANRQAVANAVVTLTVQGRGSPGRSSRQLTDGKGRFVFRSLPASDAFVLGVTRFGYFDGRYGSASAGQEKRIVLADGQWFPDARIEIWKAGAIAGTVVDEFGEPVVRAWVRVLAQIPIAGRFQLAAGPAVRTDDRGNYRISGLQPGKYVVSIPQVQHAVPAATPGATLEGLSTQAAATAEASGRVPGSNVIATDIDPNNRLLIGTYVTPPPLTGGQPQTYPALFYPNTSSLADAAPIELLRGRDREGVDFQLRPVAAWRVSGMVDGPPPVVAGLSLRLLPQGAEDLGRGSEVATALVAADGGFTFLNVPAGHYTIDARRSITEYTFATSGSMAGPFPTAPGATMSSGGGGMVFAAPAGTQYNYANSQGDATMWGRTQVDVTGSDLANVTVTMRKSMSLSGRIVREVDPMASPTGPVSAPIPVSLIMAEPAAGNASLGMPNGRVETNLNPALFRVDGLLPGTYFLRLLGGGGVKSIVWNDRDVTYTGFDAATGQDFSDVVVTLTSKRTELKGSVQGATGPVSEGAVIAFPVERGQWSSYGMQPARLRSVSITSAGTFQFTGLPAGDYNLVGVPAAQADSWKDPTFLAAAAAVATRITLGWGDIKAQTLRMSQVR
jgi:hypothetical protein